MPRDRHAPSVRARRESAERQGGPRCKAGVAASLGGVGLCGGVWLPSGCLSTTGNRMRVIGIIADTHGMLDARALAAFHTASVCAIIHAGDVCHFANRASVADILTALGAIAPVTAVRGNTDDKYAHGHGLPRTTMLTCGKARCHIYHGDDEAIHNDPITALEPADGWHGPNEIIVSGHSHKAQLTRGRHGVIHLNPGSAGPPRFNKPSSGSRCALVHVPDQLGERVRFSVVDWSGGEETATVTPWELLDEPTETEGSVATAASRKRARFTTPHMSAGSDEGGFVRVGSVGALHLKTERGAPMTPASGLTLVTHEGIAGDVHARALSPRQLLFHASPIRDALGLQPGQLTDNIFVELDAGTAATWWPPPSGSVVRLGGAAVRVTFPCECVSAGLDPCTSPKAHGCPACAACSWLPCLRRLLLAALLAPLA